MVPNSPVDLSVKVEPCQTQAGRFQWHVGENDKAPLETSSDTYESEDTAREAGEIALERLKDSIA